MHSCCNSNKLPIASIGLGVLEVNDQCALFITNLLHIPNASTNLLFHSDSFYIKDRATKKTILHGSSRNGLYKVNGFISDKDSKVDSCYLVETIDHGVAFS